MLLTELGGAGTHSAFSLEVDGTTYFLKLLRSDQDMALRREVGGMLFLAGRGFTRTPKPFSWGTYPHYVCTELLPGNALGNSALTVPQLQQIALGSKELYEITPERLDEPLWDIDWDTDLMLAGLQARNGMLAEQDKQSELEAEAAALMSDWLASSGPELFLSPSDCVVFSRGDQNLANCLWDGDRLRFVDLEDCGWNDLARDVSLLTEHIQSYNTPVEDWEWYIDQIGLTKKQRRRALEARRRQALSWLSFECLKPGSLHSFPKEKRLERLLARARTLCSSSWE